MRKNVTDRLLKEIKLSILFICMLTACHTKDNSINNTTPKIIITKTGDKIELEPLGDTVVALNQATGKLDTIFKYYGLRPAKLNGNKIFTITTLKQEPRIKSNGLLLSNYVKDEIESKLSKSDSFKDGLSDVIIDTNGTILFYRYTISMMIKQPNEKNIQAFYEPRAKLFSQMLDSLKLEPAVLNGKKVPFVFIEVL